MIWDALWQTAPTLLILAAAVAAGGIRRELAARRTHKTTARTHPGRHN